MDPYERGREARDGDDWYTEGQSVSRSPNPFRQEWSTDRDPDKARAWERGYNRLPREQEHQGHVTDA